MIIDFPDVEPPAPGTRSPAYQELLPLRTENSDSTAAILDGVADGYRAASFLDKAAKGLSPGPVGPTRGGR